MGVYVDKNLTNGVTYYYTVVGLNAQGEGPGASATAIPTSAPSSAYNVAFKTRVHLGASATLVSSASALASFTTRTRVQGTATTIGPSGASAQFATRLKIQATGTRIGPLLTTAQLKTRVRLAGVGSIVGQTAAHVDFAINPRLRGTATAIATTTPQTVPRGVQTYRVVMVNKSGVPQMEYKNATVTELVKELNQPGSMTFTLPAADPTNTESLLSAWGNEVQVWRAGKLLWWGVPTRVQTTSQTTEVQCAGLLIYFQKRFIGKANRDNYVANPSFESGIAGGWSGIGVTGSWDTTHTIMGTHSLRLDQSNVGTDTFWQQNVGGLAARTLYILSASAHIYGDVGAQHPEYHLGPALDNRGLYIELRDANGKLVDSQFAQLTYDEAFAQTVRLTTSISTIPLGDNATGAYFNLRLYAPGGITMWDAVELVTMESVSFQNADQANVLAGLVQHAQDTNFSKSDLNIVTNCPATGVVTSVAYQWADHANIFDCMNTYNGTDTGLDMDIVHDTAGTQRVFTTYYPRKGKTRTTEVLEFGKNMTDFTFSEDGEDTTTSVVELGDGSGPDRYEGFAIDTGALNGLVIEMIENAPQNTAIDALYGLAQNRLNKTKAIVKMPEITVLETPDMPLIGVVDTGDVLPVRISYGRVQYQGNFRIARLQINPVDDSVLFTLNAP